VSPHRPRKPRKPKGGLFKGPLKIVGGPRKKRRASRVKKLHQFVPGDHGKLIEFDRNSQGIRHVFGLVRIFYLKRLYPMKIGARTLYVATALLPLCGTSAFSQSTRPKSTAPPPSTKAVETKNDIARGPMHKATDGTIPDTPIGNMIRTHFERMFSFDQDAEAEYQKSLVHVRSRARDVIPVLAAAYSITPERRYLRRWALVYTLAEMQDAAAAPHLAKIAVSKIPGENSDDPERSSVGEEVRIRVTAIEGISKTGKINVKSEKLLQALMRNQQLTIRRAAIHGYVRALPAGPLRDERISKLKLILPTADHGLLSLSATNIDTVMGDMPDSFERKKRKREKPMSEPPS
jgi:hypothetical protein